MLATRNKHEYEALKVVFPTYEMATHVHLPLHSRSFPTRGQSTPFPLFTGELQFQSCAGQSKVLVSAAISLKPFWFAMESVCHVPEKVGNKTIFYGYSFKCASKVAHCEWF